MKKLLYLFLVISFSSFGQENCNNKVQLGYTSICMPEFREMAECYSNIRFKTMADLMKGTEQEKILAIYITKYNYDNPSSTTLGYPYIKIFSYNQIEYKFISQIEFNDFSKTMSSSLGDEVFLEDLYDLSNETDLFTKLNASMNKSTLLDSYSLGNNKIKSNITLMKYSVGGDVQTILGNLSIIYVKNKIIMIAYYYDYENIGSIKRLKEESDSFNLLFLDSNTQ